jgi:hypothetical protein
MEKIEINVDVITGEINQTSRPFTAEELTASQAVDATQQAAEQAQATAKQSALAKLTALGLTPEEITAIIGS